MADINLQNGFLLGSLLKALPLETIKSKIFFGNLEPLNKDYLWVKNSLPAKIVINTNSFLQKKFLSKTVLSYTKPNTEAGYCAVGDKIYILGGINSNSEIVSDIYIYDTVSKTLTKLNSILPYGVCSMQPVYYKGYIYIFGGKISTDNRGTSSIIKINTEDNTVSMAKDNIRYSIYYNAIKVIGKYAYIIGGKDNGVYGYSLIRRYNLETEIIDENYVALPARGYAFGLSNTVEQNKNVLYVFAGKTNGNSINTIVKIIIDEENFSNSTVTTVSDSGASVLGNTSCYLRAFSIDNEVCALNSTTGAIYILNKQTYSFDSLQTIGLLTGGDSLFLIDQKYKDKFYIISGSIFQLQIKIDNVEQNTLKVIIDDNVNNKISILETEFFDIKIPILSAYLGNENSVGIKVPILIYNNNTSQWESI